ncbi:MAG: cytochrome c [Anaerolineales bacterium]|nr:cytochrome c [Anaerolineales bacterium]
MSGQDQGVRESPPYDRAQVAVPANLPFAAAGRASYLENCAPCHGEQGLGDGPTVADLPSPPTAFADQAAMWELSPAMLFHTTKFGRLQKLMPPWSNQLTDDEIWNTVAFAWSLHTEEAATAAGALLYAESCAACHGDAGAGDGPEAEGNLNDFTDLADTTLPARPIGWPAGMLRTPELGGLVADAEGRDARIYPHFQLHSTVGVRLSARRRRDHGADCLWRGCAAAGRGEQCFSRRVSRIRPGGHLHRNRGRGQHFHLPGAGGRSEFDLSRHGAGGRRQLQQRHGQPDAGSAGGGHEHRCLWHHRQPRRPAYQPGALDSGRTAWRAGCPSDLPCGQHRRAHLCRAQRGRRRCACDGRHSVAARRPGTVLPERRIGGSFPSGRRCRL